MKYLILLLAVVAIGCGGSGGSGNSNPFLGDFSGTWANAETNGTIAFSITSDGHLTGTIVDAAHPGVTGTINSDCDLSGDLGNQGSVKFGADPAHVFSGNLISHDDGRFLGAELDFSDYPDIDIAVERQ
jgi:hypothetical protein